MIKTFRCKEAERIFSGFRSRKFPSDAQRAAGRKLAILDAATVLDSLRIPPGNRLEALVGDRAGQHSIHINQRWRICFCWHEGHAYDVEIVDYH